MENIVDKNELNDYLKSFSSQIMAEIAHLKDSNKKMEDGLEVD